MAIFTLILWINKSIVKTVLNGWCRMVQSLVSSEGAILSYLRNLSYKINEAWHLLTHSYRVVPAVSHELAHEAYKIRHKVYCSELNFEEINHQEIERDQYDDHSSQLVVFHKREKAYVGCARLVHGYHDGAHFPLPFEHHCHGRLDETIIQKIKESGEKYAEISRLAIDREFRHKGHSKKFGLPQESKAKSLAVRSAKSASILLSLYLGLQALSKEQGVRYVFAIVEPRLLKNFHKHGIPAVQVGQGIDHRGLRVPIVIDIHEFETCMPLAFRRLYKNIRKDVGKFLSPKLEIKDLETDSLLNGVLQFPIKPAAINNAINGDKPATVKHGAYA